MADSNGTESTTDLDVVVIGSGFAGLYALHRLRNGLGLNVRSFDNAGGVGGTWYWNRYPGARCDTEVTAYCYSFDRQLFDEWRWNERYPRQAEILAYLDHVADRFDLRRSITFGTTIESAVFDETINRWAVTTSGGESLTAQFIVAGVGLLSSTNYPNIEGRESFQGQAYHTSRWPHEGVDLRGKRVGVIGTGSSGVQCITEIAPQVKELYVFQRRPQYTVPARHSVIPRDTIEAIKQDYDAYWEGVIQTVTAFGFDESAVPAASVSVEERQRVFEEAWDIGGGFRYMFATFSDIGVDPVANDAAATFIREKIGRIVRDPAVAEKLTPHDLYARRPLCNDGYYETFNRDNVTLVDLREEPIEEIVADGIRTTAAQYDLDVIIFATGFDAVTGNYVKIDFRGRHGESLREKWQHGPQADLGLVTAGFPNLFMIFGPMGPFTNQPPAHEFQVNWVADAIAYVRDHDLETIEATPESERAWMDECNEIASGTLFPKVDSWINGSNIEGKAVSVNFYMGGMGAYVAKLRELAATGYPSLRLGRRAQVANGD
jgi:cation diffusion facilitator CzcD-associated flavoprotein CzcO